ncbi:hypothetical protein KSP40_PGU021389 [Platanthera guangdongensis]|uniref:Kinesin motor domain-containing protein n=1 Tax=Platanthera guangdongensis TaxID=2320717 RepID=A0ABR2LND9_9ASPA
MKTSNLVIENLPANEQRNGFLPKPILCVKHRRPNRLQAANISDHLSHGSQPTPRSLLTHQTPSKTPQSKQRLNFPNPKGGGGGSHPSPINTLSVTPTEHPVEVIGRIRDFPNRKEKPSSSSSSSSALEISGDGRSLRVRTDIGYRDFSLDGVSLSEIEDLEVFYKRFVESRVEGVRSGAKCTILIYGPLAPGKPHISVREAGRNRSTELSGISSGRGDE